LPATFGEHADGLVAIEEAIARSERNADEYAGDP
jgi:hypothetical protein